jgi:hypothetical protein
MANEILVPTDFPTISAAIAAAAPYDTIRVAPGTYNETLLINKSIQLLGAQAGADARSRLQIAESNVNGNSIQGIIQVTANDVVIDGFTVQNNNLGPGIVTSPSFSGYWIFNNIIQNNVFGLYFNSSGALFSQAQQNLYFNNSMPGAASGNAVYTDLGASSIYLDRNQFAGQHSTASINFAGAPGTQQNIVISNNYMFFDNSIALTNTTDVKVTQNTMRFTQGSSIFFGGGTDRTEIESNFLHNSISNGISVTTAFTATPNTNIRAKQNSIQGNATAGLNLQAGSYNAAPPNRRLDATNNWWGSPTGPAPIGTGDAVIDPDGVTEITPFLTTDPILLPQSIVTTGPFQGRGTNAQTIIVDILNNDPTNTADIEIIGFHMSTSGPKVPFVHELFRLSRSTKVQKIYNVSFEEEYEFQFATTGAIDVLISVWGVDSMGNLVPTLKILSSELVPINTLTPNVP